MSELVVHEPASPVAQVVQRMEIARTKLAEARTVAEVKQVADGAAALAEWLKRQREMGLEIVNDAQTLQFQAEKRLGEFLDQPGAVNRSPGRPEKSLPRETISPPTYRDLGIHRVAAHRCREMADVPDEVIHAVAEKASRSQRPVTRKEVLREARRIQVQATLDVEPEPPDAVPLPYPPSIPAHFHDTIVSGDAREWAKQIPDNSVMLCLCDPVWERVEDYEWLARECERVLVPGGSVIAQVGTLMRFDCEVAMRRSNLTWNTLLAEVYPFALCPLRNIKVQVGWKPYLWMSKGPRLDQAGRNLAAATYTGKDSGYLMDRTKAKGRKADEVAKARHQWGDPEDFASGLLQRLCGPDDLVWDPFSGSGTVPVAAKRLGLPFIASEIDPETAERSRRRLALVERVPLHLQRTLWDDEVAE